MGTTVKQAAARLNAMLDGIWRMGDRDECSIKHIGHATAALASGRTWQDGVDYRRPWGAEVWDNGAPWPHWHKEIKEKYLARRWAKVTALRDEVGADEFDEAVRLSKFGGYHASYMKFHWPEGQPSGR